MNHEFHTSSPLLRGVSAVAGGLATVLVAGSIYGLIVHYSAGTQVASTQPVLVARH